MASAWSSVEPIAGSYVETASAVLVAGRERAADDLVATQGHVIAVDGLCRTLAVEATVHQLDLRLGEPSEAGLEETRRVLDGLLSQLGPIADSSRYALIGTGREPLTGEEADALGKAAEQGRVSLHGAWSCSQAHDRALVHALAASRGRRALTGRDPETETGKSGRRSSGNLASVPP